MDRRFLFFQILFGSVSTIFTKIDRSVWPSAPSNSPCTKTTCPMLFKIRGCLDVSKMLHLRSIGSSNTMAPWLSDRTFGQSIGWRASRMLRRRSSKVFSRQTGCSQQSCIFQSCVDRIAPWCLQRFQPGDYGCNC